jgi:hypothetical protein
MATANKASNITSSLDSSFNTTQEMEMMAKVFSTWGYPSTLHSRENLPIVMIWHCSYAGSHSRKAENFITLFWDVQRRGNNIFCEFVVRGFVFLIVRLPQGCIFFLSHLFKKEYTATTLVVNSVVKENTSAKIVYSLNKRRIYSVVFFFVKYGTIQCDP